MQNHDVRADGNDEKIFSSIFNLIDDESTPLDMLQIRDMVAMLSAEAREEVEGFMDGILCLLVSEDEELLDQ
jgi:hypothetical protein